MNYRRKIAGLLGSLVITALVVSGCGNPFSPSESQGGSSFSRTAAGPNWPGDTTRERTIRRLGNAAFSGLGIDRQSGEASSLRWMFAADQRSGVLNDSPEHPLIAFGHLTDMQIVDDRSPLRVEYLDADANANDGGPDDSPFSSAYRPQEMLSLQMTDAMCRALSRVNTATSPINHLGLSLTLVTGDAIDNAQFNETRRYLQVLGGAPSVDWNSEGHLYPETSVGNGLGYAYKTLFGNWFNHPELWTNYWFAEKDTGTWSPGNFYSERSFPRVPGFFSEARRSFAATGLNMPWYVSIGNHDLKVQGNVPIDAADSSFNPYWTFNQIATRDEKILTVFGLDPDDFGDPNLSLIDKFRLFDRLEDNSVKLSVDPDPTRRLLTKRQFIGSHFDGDGIPNGHGFESPASDIGYYAIPSGPNDRFQFISLDTTPEDETNASGIDDAQFAWLFEQLKAASSRYMLKGSHVFLTNPGAKDKLIVVYCHDTISSLGIDGATLNAMLLQFPNVIMLVNGHTHTNSIIPHSLDLSPVFPQVRHGYWEITTASPLDWPCQSRVIEVAESDGLLSIYTTMIDADAPLAYNGDLGSAAQLASFGRQLAANDPQEIGGGIDDRRGTELDRNTQLVMPVPFDLGLFKISAIADRVHFVGDPAGFQVEVSHGTPPCHFSATGLPPGMRIDEATGLISGDLRNQGTFAVEVRSSDATGQSARRNFAWQVKPFEIGRPADQLLIEGETASVGIPTLHGNAPNVWSAAGLPPGAAIDAHSGAISGVPNTPGIFTSTVTARLFDCTVQVSFKWTILKRIVLLPIPERQAYTSSWQVENISQMAGCGDLAGYPSNPIQYRWTVSGLPPASDHIFVPEMGFATFTPSARGIYAVNYSVTDGLRQTVSASYSIRVSDLRVGSIAKRKSFSQLQETGRILMSCSGGVGAYTWSFSGLPSGFQVDASTGDYSGAAVAAGTYVVTATVRDAEGASRSTNFVWEVAPSLGPGLAFLPGDTWIGYDSCELDPYYRGGFHAVNGTPPYAYSVVNLPPGLSYDPATNTISGIFQPGWAGSSGATITVTDATGASAQGIQHWQVFFVDG